jgi:hypothetical protein
MNALEFVDAISDALGWGEVTSIVDDVSSDTRKVIRNAGMVLNSMQSDQDWQSLRSTGKILTQPPLILTNQVLAVVKGDRTINFTGALPAVVNQDLSGCIISLHPYDATVPLLGDGGVSTHPTSYRLEAHNGSTSFELDKPWMYDTEGGANAYTITISRDRYQLPADYDRLKGDTLYNITTGKEMRLVNEHEVRKDFSTTVTPAEPETYTIYGLTSKGNPMLHLNIPADELYILSFDYQKNHPPLVGDKTEILYPVRYHMFMVDSVKARLDRDAENKQQAMQVANDALAERIRQEATPEPGSSRNRFTPSTGRPRLFRRR